MISNDELFMLFGPGSTLKPCAFGKELRRVINANVMLTFYDIATASMKPAGWLFDRDLLNNLIPEIAELVDSGDIPIANATLMAKKANAFDQKHLMNVAQTMSPNEFASKFDSLT